MSKLYATIAFHLEQNIARKTSQFPLQIKAGPGNSRTFNTTKNDFKQQEIIFNFS